MSFGEGAAYTAGGRGRLSRGTGCAGADGEDVGVSGGDRGVFSAAGSVCAEM